MIYWDLPFILELPGGCFSERSFSCFWVKGLSELEASTTKKSQITPNASREELHEASRDGFLRMDVIPGDRMLQKFRAGINSKGAIRTFDLVL